MNKDHSTEREIKELDELAKKMLKQLGADEQVVQHLIRTKGLQEQYARAIVDNIYTSKERKRNFWKSMVMGGTAVLAGLFMTIVSYSISASSGGYSFFLFYGIIAFDIIAILRGFILYK